MHLVDYNLLPFHNYAFWEKTGCGYCSMYLATELDLLISVFSFGIRPRHRAKMPYL